MTAAASYNYKQQQQQQQQQPSSSSSRPPKNPNPNHPLTAAAAAAASPFQINPPNPNEDPTSSSSAPASPFPVPFQDQVLSKASHLTRLEVLRRRSRKLKQLSKCYRDHYWALMEELKSQYRAYYWNYGLSPFKEDNSLPIKQEPSCDLADSGVCNCEGIGENNNNNNGSGGIGHCSGSRVLDAKLENNLRCSFVGCNLKAMALTSFCHLHILYDPEQKLYRPCSFVIKSPAAGPITCGKPILSSTVPSYCSSHFRTAHKHITRALKNAGLNVTSSTKLAPKFHVIVAEYVNQIQAKRQAAKLAGKGKAVDNKS